MVSVRRVAPILLLAVTIPAWAEDPQAAKTAPQPVSKTTTAKTATETSKAPAPVPAKVKPATATTATAASVAPATTAPATPAKKAAAKPSPKPVEKPAEKVEKPAAPKPPAKAAAAKTTTHPPRELHKVGDHWTAYNPPDPSTYPAGAKTYTVKHGDTLWALGQQFYNNAYLWPQLWEANTWVTDAHWIYPGDVLLVEGEVTQHAEQGTPATETTPAIGGGTTAAPATQAPSGISTATPVHPLITAADAVGGTTYPVPLGTDGDIYCYGYIGKPGEPLPNKVLAWEDVEVRYQKGALDQTLHGSEGDLLFIDGGSSTGLNAGETYLLVEPTEMVVNPRTHEVIGQQYDYIGQVRVLCTEATRSRGLITQSCREIPIGARLKPLPQIPIPLAKIPSLPAFCDPSSGKKTGVILTAQGGAWLEGLGEGQLVQINLGSADQVQPGEFLTVFREGIPGVTPRQVLGELAVLTAENHTATAKVVLMRYAMRVGDLVEIR